MSILIRGARVFAPTDLGVKDVLVVHQKIVAVGENLNPNLDDLEIIEGKGLLLTPGFIDQHGHVTGGGGEGGPKTRTPELVLSELIECGTTTVVGVSGTDGTSRSIPNLLAKVRALQDEGVSAWMYTSNYAFPPTLLSQIRVGAMVAGKLGVLHIHLGNIPGPFEIFKSVVAKGFPIGHIRPTHCARDKKVFEAALEFGTQGGYVDITTGGSCAVGTPAHGIVEALKAGVPLSHLTMSTDGHGSVPRFNEKGEMIGLGVGGVNANLRELKRLIGELKMPIADALSLITANPAKALRLSGKGEIKTGFDADINLFNDSMELLHVVAKGVHMMRNKEILKKGTFE